jgi:L-cystine transport system substrate-binding protein
MKKALFFVIVLAVAGEGLVHAAGSSEKKGAEKGVTTIIVGTGVKYPPYCYTDAAGNLIGYDHKLLQEIDRRLPQYEFKYEVFDFANILIALGQGKVDIGAHQYESNPDRRATYLFGDEEYNDYDSWLTVKADGPWANVNSIDDLAGNPNAIISVGLGSNREAFVKNYNQTHDAAHQLAYQPYTEDAVLLENLKSGRFSATLQILLNIDRYNSVTEGLRLIPRGDKPVIDSGAYFIFAKTNVELKEAVDGALRDIKADGTFNRIYKEVVTDYYANL